MLFIQWRREKPPLPQVSAGAILSIEACCVSRVRVSKRQSQRVALFWHSHKMNMIGHQTIRPNLDGIRAKCVTDAIQIGVSISIIRKDFLAAIAPLRDMVGQSRKRGIPLTPVDSICGGLACCECV